MSTTWEHIAADKRGRIDKCIPPEWKISVSAPENSVIDIPASSGVLSPQELKITESTASELVPRLAKGELKAVDVTLAFCKRAALAHQLTNCALELFPEAALVQAKELDAYFEKHKKPVGPLHGLPVSLKDQARVKGIETSMGYIDWLGKIEKEDSILVSILRRTGAVFYVKTSVPQTLMVCETVNNIIGRTINPRNKNWSCGGSSGGEGALIGIRGGIMGVGTDIGGSIRVPAAFNFLYGIRPSHGRLPYARMANSMEGQETVHSVVGPIAHSAADLRLFLTAVLAEEPWDYDPKVVPLPWRPSEEDAIKERLKSGLSIGYYHSDGNVLPHPPVLRAVDTVISTLKKNGHNLIEWTPYKHGFAVDMINGIFAADGSTDVYSDISASGEPAIPNIKELLNPDSPKIDLNQLWEVNLQKWAYQTEYLTLWREAEARLGNGQTLDAIIAPVTASAAIRHDRFKYYGYATVVNLLDFTSAVVPVTFADKTVDKKIEKHTPMNALDADVQEEYDPEAYDGAPVAVQVIGRRLSEEKTLAIAEEVGRLLGNVVTP